MPMQKPTPSGVDLPKLPGWMTPWRNDAGRWWTVREKTLSTDQRNAGCAVSVSAGTLDVLVKVVKLQNTLADVAAGGVDQATT